MDEYFLWSQNNEWSSVFNEDCMLCSSPGDHRHCPDHLWHRHPGTWTAWDDRSSGWGSAPASASGSQATHYGHWSHLQRLGWDEEPDSPWCAPGGVAEMEARRRLIYGNMFLETLSGAFSKKYVSEMEARVYIKSFSSHVNLSICDSASVSLPVPSQCLRGYQHCPTV